MPTQSPSDPVSTERASCPSLVDEAVYAIANSVAGADGGTLAINLAAAFAEKGCRVVVVNAGVETTDIVMTDRLDVTGPTLSDVLTGDARIGAAIRPGPAGLDVVPMGAGDRPGCRGMELGQVLRRLRELYDVVLVQANGKGRWCGFRSGVFDKVVVSTFSEKPAVRGAADLIEAIGAPSLVVVVVLFGPSPTARTVEDIAGELGTEVAAVVPNTTVVWESLISGRPVSRGGPRSRAATVYRDLAESLHPTEE